MVRDLETGAELSDVELVLIARSGRARGRTDLQGRFQFPPVAAPESIIAEKLSYSSVESRIPTERAHLEILLPPAPAVSCTFALANAKVRVKGKLRIGSTSGDPNSFHPLLERAVAGDTVEFELDRKESGGRIRFLGDLEGYALIPMDLELDPRRRRYRVDLEVRPAMECQGRVLTEERAPIVGADVEATGAGLSFRTSRTDETGQFILHGLSPSTIRVSAGHADYSGSGILVDLLQTQYVEIVLARRTRGRVAGRIIDAAGRPIPDAEVDTVSAQATTAQDGTFNLELSESATATDHFSLRARRKGYADLRYVNEGLPQRPLELKMFAAGSLALEQSAEGEREIFLQLVTETETIDPAFARSFKAGFKERFTPVLNTKAKTYEFERDGLLPGLYRVTINPGTPAERSLVAEIKPGIRVSVRCD